MASYKHLSLEEKEKIFVWREQNISFREIGRRLGRAHTSILKELDRNKTSLGKRAKKVRFSS